MNKFLSIAFSFVLVLHGIVHLMGTVTYLQLGTVEGLAYKTTLLNTGWDVGQGGMAIFGALWAVAGVSFMVAALSFLARWPWARPLLLATGGLSLALTVLDWDVAYAGIVLNVIILALIGLGPKVRARFLFG